MSAQTKLDTLFARYQRLPNDEAAYAFAHLMGAIGGMIEYHGESIPVDALLSGIERALSAWEPKLIEAKPIPPIPVAPIHSAA